MQQVKRYFEEGHKLFKLNKLDESLQCFERVIEINTRYDAAYINKGSLCEKLGKYEEAVSCFDWAIRLKPNHHTAYNCKGSVLEKMARYEQAVACYDRVILLEPLNKYAHNNKGEALLRLGRAAQSIVCFDDCLLLDGKFVYALYNKSYALFCLQQYTEATLLYQQVILLDAHVENQYIKEAHEQIANPLGCKDALNILSQVIALNPTKKEAIVLIGCCCYCINTEMGSRVHLRDKYNLMKRVMRVNHRTKKKLKNLKKLNNSLRIELNGHKEWYEGALKETQLLKLLSHQKRMKITPANHQQPIIDRLRVELQQLTLIQVSYFKTFYWSMLNVVCSYADNVGQAFSGFVHHLGLLNKVVLSERESMTVLELLLQQPQFTDLFPCAYVTIYVVPGVAVTAYTNAMLAMIAPSKIDHRRKVEIIRELVGFAFQDHISLVAQLLLDLGRASMHLTMHKDLDCALNPQLPTRYKQDLMTYTDYIQNQLFQKDHYSVKAGCVAYQDVLELLMYVFDTKGELPKEPLYDSIPKIILQLSAKNNFTQHLKIKI